MLLPKIKEVFPMEEQQTRQRTVAYCRVSTEEQTISLESQIKHFTDIMDSSPNMSIAVAMSITA